MTFEIEVAGRLRTVSVEHIGSSGAGGGRFRLTITDMTADEARPVIEVDAGVTDLGLSLLYQGTLRSVDAAITDQGTDWLIQLPHVDVMAVVDRRRFARDSSSEGSHGGQQNVTAPMPG